MIVQGSFSLRSSARSRWLSAAACVPAIAWLQARQRCVRELSGSRLTAREVSASDSSRCAGVRRWPGKDDRPRVQDLRQRHHRRGEARGGGDQVAQDRLGPAVALGPPVAHQRLRLHPELVLAPHRRGDLARRLQPRRRQVHVQRHREVAQRGAVQRRHAVEGRCLPLRPDQPAVRLVGEAQRHQDRIVAPMQADAQKVGPIGRRGRGHLLGRPSPASRGSERARRSSRRGRWCRNMPRNRAARPPAPARRRWRSAPAGPRSAPAPRGASAVDDPA